MISKDVVMTDGESSCNPCCRDANVSNWFGVAARHRYGPTMVEIIDVLFINAPLQSDTLSKSNLFLPLTQHQKNRNCCNFMRKFNGNASNRNSLTWFTFPHLNHPYQHRCWHDGREKKHRALKAVGRSFAICPCHRKAANFAARCQANQNQNDCSYIM